MVSKLKGGVNVDWEVDQERPCPGQQEENPNIFAVFTKALPEFFVDEADCSGDSDLSNGEPICVGI